MAEKPGPEKDPVILRSKIARSRELVVRDLKGLAYELNFPLKLKRAFQHDTVLWIGSAVALGLLISLLRARTKKVYVSRGGDKKTRKQNSALLDSGLFLGALKLGLNLLQPMIATYLKEKVKGSRNPPNSPRW